MSATRFASLTPMLAPRSVAILGASSDPTRIGGRPIAAMLARGFRGSILPVNPNRAEIQGLTAYPSVAALPERPDVAIVAVAADRAQAALEDLAAIGVTAVIMFTAGFAEIDPTGAGPETRSQAILAETARAHGMRLLGPNSLGAFNDAVGFYATFSASTEGGFPPPGRIGIASQSGAFGSHVFALARNRGIGTPILVTTGNEADITIGDVIGWLAEHDGTDVIVAYAEGIRRADSLLPALAAARSARKPVVLMKVGSSAIGRAAARSHTASLTGDDAVTDAVLAEFGVVRARTTEAMLDIAALATRRIYPVRNTLGVITLSGGAGVLIGDAAEALGLALPPMPEAAQAELKALIPFAAPANPVDCTAQVFNDTTLIGRFTDSMVRDGGYSSVLAFFSQVGGAASLAGRIRAELAAVRERHPDRLYVMSVIADHDVVAAYEQAGFTVMEDPTRAVVALEAMGRFGAAFAAAPPGVPAALPAIALPPATPSEAEAKIILGQAGIATVPEAACADAESAVAAARRLGFPVVMKILSPDILHKSEIGGVILDVAGEPAARAAFATLMRRAPAGARIEGVLVAKQVTGVECILGVATDPVFGKIAAFGLGGVFVEVLRDVVLRRCPFGVAEAEAMIRSIKGAPLLLGARGRPPVDIAALAAMLSRLSVFADQAGPRLAAIDLNPVFATPDGAYAADAVLEIVTAESV